MSAASTTPADSSARTADPPVVTIFETYGAGASYVGHRVAQELGVPWVEQAFSSENLEVAEAERAAAHQDETFLDRVLNIFSPGVAVLDNPSIPVFQADDNKSVEANTRTVLQAAHDGGVILGRNGAKILAKRSGALHVKLDAPVEDRINRAVADTGIDPERARRRQQSEDRVRVELSKRFYDFDSADPAGYDMVINTSAVGLDGAVKIILAAFDVKAARV